jgi:hypothetical protein
MTISCEECGAPFEFVGVEGGSGVILSPDRRELRLAIAETAKGMVQ